MFTWELPQTVLGLFLLLVTRGVNSEKYVHARVYWRKTFWGVSLGGIIILGEGYRTYLYVIEHEYGHSIQSLLLGPLYLVVVGLPSIVMNLLSRANILDPERYYRRWPETWADKLGGVPR